MKYQIELTERQLQDLNYACELMSRIRCGQMRIALRNLIEEAYERNDHKEMDEAWWEMRHEVEDLLDRLKKIGWKQPRDGDFGVHYDEQADRLFDMHQVIRNILYWERHKGEKTHMAVDGYTPLQFGNDPLIKVKKI